MRFSVASSSRRALFAAAATVLQPMEHAPGALPFALSGAAAAAVNGAAPAPGGGGAAPAAAALLSLIPTMKWNAPATNLTIAAELVREIEERAAALEAQAQRDLARSPLLDGQWKLLYSNAREIRNLALGLPLGFALGETFQPLDTATGRFENIGSVEQAQGVARARTRVVGDLRPAPPGTFNAARIQSTRGERVDVDFRRITFELDELFGRPASLRKVVLPRPDPNAPQQSVDVTYIDAGMRVTRGGDGSLFILRRVLPGTEEEARAPALLTAAERELLFAERGRDVVTGKGSRQSENAGSPELRQLLKL